MSKSVAASIVLLPLLAACPPDSSPCHRIGMDPLIEVRPSSTAANKGDCSIPPAFRLRALGCSGMAQTYSADLCVISYDLFCAGDQHITIEVRQETDDGIVGALHKEDDRNDCSLDLEISVKDVPETNG